MPSRLLSQGFAIASLDYRLSGDAVFPAALEDCKAAVRWLRAHAAEFNLNPDSIVAWGESAGGHLASMLGVTCASPKGDEFEVGDNLERSSAVAGVVAYYGPTDFLLMDVQAPKDGMSLSHDLPDSPEARFIGGAIQDVPDKVARANPMTYISEQEKPPPFFLAHGKGAFYLLCEAYSSTCRGSSLTKVRRRSRSPVRAECFARGGVEKSWSPRNNAWD